MPTEKKLRELFDEYMGPRFVKDGDNVSPEKWDYQVHSYDNGGKFEIIISEMHEIPAGDFKRLGEALHCEPKLDGGKDEYQEGEVGNRKGFPTKAIYRTAELDGERFYLSIRGERPFKPRGSHQAIAIPEGVKQKFVVLAEKEHPANFPERNARLNELIEKWKLDEYEKRRGSE